MNGAELIYKERNRQLRDEGWTPQHDDAHSGGELSRAAECYVVAAQTAMVRDDAARYHKVFGADQAADGPGDEGWWKPSNDPIRNLVKAGALIAAEIDRLQRAEEERKHQRAVSGADFGERA